MEKPVYTKDGFLFFKEGKRVENILDDRLIIEFEKISQTIKYVKKNGIKNITINPSYSKVENLEFLKEMHMIEGLYLLQEGLDISSLSCLNYLRVLTVSDLKPKLDLANFPNLEVFGANYSKKITNIGECKKLFWLWLDNFDEEDMEKLSLLESLEYLWLYKPKSITLNGISNLLNLKELHIDTAKNLISLRNISENNSVLSFIDIFRAPNLVDYDALENVKTLNKIRLTKTGDLKSLSFIKNNNKLVKVALGLKIVDGNMAHLKGIEDVSFLDFPHYNLKSKDFKN